MIRGWLPHRLDGLAVESLGAQALMCFNRQLIIRVDPGQTVDPFWMNYMVGPVGLRELQVEEF